MAYTFQSRATADLIMLDATAKKLLELMGKIPAKPGIVTVDQIPDALRALEAAVQEDDERRKTLQEQLNSADKEAMARAVAVAAELGSVTLRQRVAPFAEMLRRSAEEGKDVTWLP